MSSYLPAWGKNCAYISLNVDSFNVPDGQEHFQPQYSNFNSDREKFVDLVKWSSSRLPLIRLAPNWAANRRAQASLKMSISLNLASL